MNQPTFAQILHHAADVCLEHSTPDDHESINLHYFSCDAVQQACIDLIGEGWLDKYQAIIAWLRALGVDTMSYSAFSEFEPGTERQGARYLWLKFAALVAEEEGL